jgi:predicted deacylase
MRGTFVGIPVANPFAFEARARVAPLAIDGLNLARVFPGAPDGSPSRVLACALLDLVERHVTEADLFVDFHSGSADVAFATLVGFRDVQAPARERSEEAARHFGLPALWRIPDSPGPFNAETARRGIPTIGTETTGRAGCDPAGVEAFSRGLLNLLAFLGMRDSVPRPARFDGLARSTVDVVAPSAGFLRVSRRLHEDVAAGDELGTLVDVLGDTVDRLIAPVAGTIWAARSMPAIRSGELAFVIAG